MRLILILALCSVTQLSFAQDVALTNPYLAPLLLGPVLAGGANTSRVNIMYKNQWPRINRGFRETYISYDQRSDAIHGGLGGYYHQSRDTNGVTYYRMYGSANFNLISGDGNFRFVAGVEAGYIHGTLRFTEYLNPPEGLYERTVNCADIGASLAVHSHRYSLIAGVQHLNRPKTGFNADEEFRLPMKLSVAATALIPVGGRYSEANISPMIYYTMQGDTQNLLLSFMFNKNWFLYGVAYRNRDAFNLFVGLRLDRFRLMYTFDFTVSAMSKRNPGTAHEVGLMLYLKPQDDRAVFPSVEFNGFDSKKDYPDSGSR